MVAQIVIRYGLSPAATSSRVEQPSCCVDVTVQRADLRQHPGHEQLQITAHRILFALLEAREQKLLGLAQIPKRFTDVADMRLVDTPGLQTVRAHHRVGGGVSLFEQPLRQWAAAVELDGLVVGRPAGEEKTGGLQFPAEAGGQMFGALQQLERRGAVHRSHSDDRGELRQRGQLQLPQTRRPRDLHGRAQLPLGGLERTTSLPRSYPHAPARPRFGPESASGPADHR